MGALRPRRPVFYGWWIAGAYFVMNLYWGGTLMMGFSALFNPIRDAFGLSSTVATAVISLRHGVAVVGSPIVGYLFDRVGPRPLMLVATVSAAGGMSLLALSHSTWLFFLSFAIASIGFAIFIAGTGPAAAANWFIRHRGKAIAIVVAGGSVGSFLVPAVVWLEDGWGWRTTVIVIVVGLMVVGMPASLLLRHRPEQYGLRPDGEPADAGPGPPPPPSPQPGDLSGLVGGFGFREAMSTHAFWLLAAGLFVASLGSSAVALFIIPHLQDEGFSKAAAGVTVTGLGLLGFVSTLAVGWLSDYLERRYLIMVAYLLQGGGLAFLAFASSVWHLVPFALLFGIGSRAAFPVVSSLQADYFGRANFGKIQGVLFSTFTAGSALGPILGAAVRDAVDSYTPIFAIYAGMTAIAVLAASLVRRPESSALAVPVERAKPR